MMCTTLVNMDITNTIININNIYHTYIQSSINPIIRDSMNDTDNKYKINQPSNHTAIIIGISMIGCMIGYKYNLQHHVLQLILR